MLVDHASALFERHFGQAPREIAPVAGDGSARRYWRLTGTGGDRAVGGHGPDREENHAFLSFSRTFRELGLPVPEIYAADDAAGVWLLEDLGDVTLFEAIKRARTVDDDSEGAGLPETVVPLYRRVLEWLPRFQVEGGREIDFSVAYPRAAFDRRSIVWDLNYFKYHFLKLARLPFSEARLEGDFDRLADFLLRADTDFFLYRDFQSRNVMVRPGEDGSPEPWFIDYQGGRRGALMYDVASLLYDAKADLGSDRREELLAHYLDALESHVNVDRAGFRELWPGYVLVRVLQALGAYGYRGFFERKPRFLQSVPYAARNIAGLLDEGLPLALPELESALARIVEKWGADDTGLRTGPRSDTLTVQVGSFAYRHGLPDDPAGHGGGHVFDCRALPNPGREPAYRRLTGLDPETIEYLSMKPEVGEFWSRVRDIVDAHVVAYCKRGFHSLSVHFGCTGGQHRSVYMAERLAAHLRVAHPEVDVILTHRERTDWPWKG